MFVCFVVLIRVESTCHCPTMLDRSAMASSAADCSRVLELVLCSTKSWMISMFFFTSFFLFHQWWLHSNQAFKSCLVGGILSWDHLSFFLAFRRTNAHRPVRWKFKPSTIFSTNEMTSIKYLLVCCLLIGWKKCLGLKFSSHRCTMVRRKSGRNLNGLGFKLFFLIILQENWKKCNVLRSGVF